MIDTIAIDENNTLLIAKYSMANRSKTKELIRELIIKYMRTTGTGTVKLIHRDFVPYIVNMSGSNLANCSFSYAGNYAVSFISNNRNIGIDIELSERINRTKEIIYEYLDIDETLISCKSIKGFMWSLYEAIGKLEKVGIFRELKVLDVEDYNEEQDIMDKFANKINASKLIDSLCYKSSSINKMVKVSYKVRQNCDKKVAICYLLQAKGFYLVVALEKLKEVGR